MCFCQRYLSGKKLLAIFGLLDNFWKERLQKKWDEEVKTINFNAPLDTKDRIVIKMLRDRLMDLGPCDKV